MEKSLQSPIVHGSTGVAKAKEKVRLEVEKLAWAKAESDQSCQSLEINYMVPFLRTFVKGYST